MKIPKVSVIIPTYNREELIQRAVQSLLNQTNQDFEAFVIDDASTDNTAEVIKRYKDNRIKYIRMPENKGQCVTRNIAIKQARGEYIGFLDSDDEWMPEKIEKQLRVFERSGDPNLAAVYSGLVITDEIQNKTFTVNRDNLRGDLYIKLLEGYCPATPTLFLVKKSVLDEVQGFDEVLPTFVDYDLWLRIAQLGYTFDFVDEPLIVKHEHAGSQIAKDLAKRKKGLELFLEKWGDEIIEKAGRETYRNIQRRKIEALVDANANNPGANYKNDMNASINLLLGVRSRNFKLYMKLFVLLLLGKNSLRLLKRSKSIF
jgi:glycosyltransferase involved in cell wall biosynthesis